ncbi:low molecular weight protein-tyrosine-phosphatase [Eubacteriales bacterium KG127]
MNKILFICHGNICRSTMAESIMTHLVKESGLENEFKIYSAATSREEIGNPPHPGTVRKLKEKNIPLVPHKAVQMTRKDYDSYDYLIAMDKNNLRNMKKFVGNDPDTKVSLLLSHSGASRNDSNLIEIADPWYTGNFDETYDDIMEGCKGLLKELYRKDK